MHFYHLIRFLVTGKAVFLRINLTKSVITPSLFRVRELAFGGWTPSYTSVVQVPNYELRRVCSADEHVTSGVWVLSGTRWKARISVGTYVGGLSFRVMQFPDRFCGRSLLDGNERDTSLVVNFMILECVMV